MTETLTTECRLPMTARMGAEELLLIRLSAVSLLRYLEGVRIVYRLATSTPQGSAPRLDDLASRFRPRPGRMSPPLQGALVEHAIRSAVGREPHEPIRKRDTLAWLDTRQREIAAGARHSIFDDAERQVLFPEWAIEPLAAFLEDGPTRTRDLVERWGRDFANGHDGFRSKKARDEPSRDVPTPNTVGRMGDVFVSLFSATKTLRLRYGSQAPTWLEPWPGDWELTLTPHERATGKRRTHMDDSGVRDALLAADAACAAPFRARFGATDLELARDPERFWVSFSTREEARTWLENKHIALLSRDRAVTCVAVIAGERLPQLASVRRRDLKLDSVSHVALSEKRGFDRAFGSVFFQASAKTTDLPAHDVALPVEVCDRLRAYLFACEVLRLRPLPPSAPLILKDMRNGGRLAGLTTWAICDSATRLLIRYGAIEAREGDGRSGFNVIRRYTDRSVLDNFNEWKTGRDGISDGIHPETVKEALLGHTRITIDPYTYAGLGDADGRLMLSGYGAETIARVIWSSLGRRRGPDETRIRSELAHQRGLAQALARVEGELARIEPEMVNPPPGAPVEVYFRTTGRNHILERQARSLEKRIGRHELTVTELVFDREQWIELRDGQRRLTKKDLRALSDDLLGTRHGLYPPIRDFLTLNELAADLGVSTDSVSDWIADANPERASRRCPWQGTAPIHRPNKRTVLIAVSALDPIRIDNPDRWSAIQRRLSTWPVGRGWDRNTGAKTRAVIALARTPAALCIPPANDLLAAPTDACVCVFAPGAC